jgi:hydrogenase maturation protease
MPQLAYDASGGNTACVRASANCRRVLCVGNSLCHDDGVAFAIADSLRELGIDAEILEAGEFGLDCLDVFIGASHVVIVDAVCTNEAPIGHCTVLSDPTIIAKGTCSIGHAITVSAMLELVRTLEHGRLPKVRLVGIEAGNLAPFGTTLSPAVRASIPAAIRAIFTALELPIHSGVNLCDTSAIGAK